jgi:hypothetical protein|tara:strand:- start:1090 stop:1437 length:348 start_codon:yes stop_codon:yes gene_type:complete
MINKMVLITIGIFLFNNILIWYQLNSQLVWDWAKTSKSMWFMSLMGIPISLLFWYATKIGYVGFGNLWAVRFIGFATSMLTFPVMTYLYLGEALTLKTIITVLLATVIMLIQILL